MTQEGFAVFEHGFRGLLGVVKGIVLIAEMVFQNIDSFSQGRQGFAILAIAHAQEAR